MDQILNLKAHSTLTISCPEPHCCAAQDCAIQSVSDGIIVCMLPNDNTAGANAILVTVEGKGYASSMNPEQPIIAFTNPLGISGVSPSEVSVEGGGEVTITGETCAIIVHNIFGGGMGSVKSSRWLIIHTPSSRSCSFSPLKSFSFSCSK